MSLLETDENDGRSTWRDRPEPRRRGSEGLVTAQKMPDSRMVELVRRYGSWHITINSAADRDASGALRVPKRTRAMFEPGIVESDVEMIVLGESDHYFWGGWPIRSR
jgi:hypothetical protein